MIKHLLKKLKPLVPLDRPCLPVVVLAAAAGMSISMSGCGEGSSSEGASGGASDSTPPTASEAAAAAADIDAASLTVGAATLVPEKTDLEFGFIKLTDCAPLVIAKEKGFFADEGLNVQLTAQANWKILLERVISGELDGAHMLAGQPIAATIGVGSNAHVITPYSLDYNGNGITVSPEVWAQMQANDPALASPTPPHPISADALAPLVEQRFASGDPLKMGMVFPVSTHNYELRYWLAASGIHPGMYTPQDTTGQTDAQVLLSVTPPPQMPATLDAGTIDGYCVGEPWNQVAVAQDIGVPVVTNYEIWRDNPEKVFGITAQWQQRHPQATIAVVKALIRAGMWLDQTDAEGNLINREEAATLLAEPHYVGAEAQIIRNSMTGFFYFQKTDKQAMPRFNVFFDGFASYPWYSDAIWFLTQMRRWGQIAEPKPESWYHETAAKIYKPGIYREAAKRLIAEGKLDPAQVPPATTDGYRPETDAFIDGKTYDGRKPLDYLASFEVGHQR